MKNYIGSLIAMATLVAYSSASFNCTQPLEMWSHSHKLLLSRHICDQEVQYSDLLKEPEIFYDGYLPQNYNYTLFLLENNNITGSYRIYWYLTDIIPMNKSLTANKRIVAEYRPPTNNMTTVLFFRHRGIHLIPPSNIELNNFIPNAWAAPIQNITLENNATFHVIGINASHPHPSGTILPHTPPQTHTSPHHTVPTFETPKTTARPPYVTQTITEKVHGYHSYNSTNSTNHSSPSHPHKSGASSNVGSLTVIFIPLISVITKVIY